MPARSSIFLWLLMRRWDQVKAGDGAVVLIGGEPGNREIAPRAAAHRVAEARVIFNRFRSAAAVVVAVRMWATRLRCPSCARRGYARSCVDLVGRGAGLLTAVGRWMDVTGYSSGSMQVRILSRR
jgi:hypothetical protein